MNSRVRKEYSRKVDGDSEAHRKGETNLSSSRSSAERRILSSGRGIGWVQCRGDPAAEDGEIGLKEDSCYFSADFVDFEGRRTDFCNGAESGGVVEKFNYASSTSERKGRHMPQS